ncbi:DUF3299 domain-containing protein [Pontivivens nitratireducens]|uniref:DUF3299 domain-containing protein n=1 Tax=Pontivivens nitratireducens TaxID=2758038 RepID=A0A6G7VL07_9RHOB|nr:DUF3299 domain-containing protein [Pontibrevibacter nitratireducens]QIK40477.1 DUF3299 domain-containing protein [Pontibrevibacter nitratireducens]
MNISRRTLILSAAPGALVPSTAFAATPLEITWDDLIPPGVPYSEIIGEGELDEENDYWRPIFDANATRLNTALDGAYIKMPGYIIPLDLTADGVTEFVLVPYVGACIHTPPPPPNQLVFVTTSTPWPGDKLWDAVWVTGHMRHQLQSTEVAETGYALTAEEMEVYVW